MQMNDSGHETDDRLEALFFDNLDKNGDSLAVVVSKLVRSFILNHGMPSL